jgi:hypothetical protein
MWKNRGFSVGSFFVYPAFVLLASSVATLRSGFGNSIEHCGSVLFVLLISYRSYFNFLRCLTNSITPIMDAINKTAKSINLTVVKLFGRTIIPILSFFLTSIKLFILYSSLLHFIP